MQNAPLITAGIVFLLVSIMHFLRLVFKVKVTFANFTVPLWYSFLGFLLSLSLSIWMFRSIR